MCFLVLSFHNMLSLAWNIHLCFWGTLLPCIFTIFLLFCHWEKQCRCIRRYVYCIQLYSMVGKINSAKWNFFSQESPTFFCLCLFTIYFVLDLFFSAPLWQELERKHSRESFQMIKTCTKVGLLLLQDCIWQDFGLLSALWSCTQEVVCTLKAINLQPCSAGS